MKVLDTVHETKVELTRTGVFKRLAVSLAVFTSNIIAASTPIPFIKPNEALLSLPRSSWSILAVGLAPLVSSYLLVEMAALLVPAWRAMRRSSAERRIPLKRAAIGFGLALSFIQALILANRFEAMGIQGAESVLFKLKLLLLLLGAAAALIVAASVVDRHGLGSGFAVLILAQWAPAIVEPLMALRSAFLFATLEHRVLHDSLFILALPVAATVWLSTSFCLPIGKSSDHPDLISRPACGVSPLAFLGVFIAVANVWTLSKGSGSVSTNSNGLNLLLIGLISCAFAFLFNPPHRIATFWEKLVGFSKDQSPQLVTVLPECVLFIVMAGALELWGSQWIGVYVPAVSVTIVATAIFIDLVVEFRARQRCHTLVPVWEIHQVYAVAPTLRMLETVNIKAFATNKSLRSMVQFFGPHVPIQIMVPLEDAPRARTLLEARWPTDA